MLGTALQPVILWGNNGFQWVRLRIRNGPHRIHSDKLMLMEHMMIKRKTLGYPI
jgi:hypothetical protein